MEKILITGGAGFIGSNLLHFFNKKREYQLINVDKLTYAGNLESLREINSDDQYIFIKGDICNRDFIWNVLDKHRPTAVIHLAAESHVDRSIDNPGDFINTNVVGTFNLLENVRHYLKDLREIEKKQFKFLHISTDEVYGTLGEKEYFTEDAPYRPNSPYSASKAASDHLVRAYHQTYKVPAIISNCSNNYGPRQFPEKLIPLMILNALEDKNLPVYGTGQNIRDWLFVEDHCRALDLIFERGVPGEAYNIGGNTEKTNLEVVKEICLLLDEVKPREDGRSYSKQITFVEDRPGHDLRYAVDTGKINNELGWKPLEDFKSGLRKTVLWYLENQDWCKRIQDGSYQRQRLGIIN